MLYGEYDPEVEMRVVREEALEEGMEIGREEGLEEGIEIGMEEGEEIGMKKEKLIIAKNLLSEGSTPEFVHRITGIDLDEIERLKN